MRRLVPVNALARVAVAIAIVSRLLTPLPARASGHFPAATAVVSTPRREDVVVRATFGRARHT